MPFVQGHLRNESLSITFKTECAHCSRPIQIGMDSELNCRVVEDTDPLVFVPMVDFDTLEDPSIIDGF
jgi:hypothetical protein